jgi:hypothetical protein
MVSRIVAVSGSLAVVALLAGACDDATSKQQKAEQAQVQADQQKTAAEQQAADKTAAAWDAAAQQIDQAQAKADRAWDAAASATAEEESDYDSRVDKVIADIDSKLSDVRTSAATGAGAAQRTLSNEVVANMTKRRAALVDDKSAIDRATSATWPALRLKVDADLEDSKTYMRTASARLNGSHR